jgi:hypothetical protein
VVLYSKISIYGKKREVSTHAHFSFCKLLSVCVSRSALELKDEGVKDVDLGAIPMPDIEYKSAVTGDLKSYLDILREGYQQKFMKE